jgi:hypothetical protein
MTDILTYLADYHQFAWGITVGIWLTLLVQRWNSRGADPDPELESAFRDDF